MKALLNAINFAIDEAKEYAKELDGAEKEFFTMTVMQHLKTAQEYASDLLPF